MVARIGALVTGGGGEACCHALPVSPLSSDAPLRFSSTITSSSLFDSTIYSTLFNSFLSFFFLLFFVVDRMLAFHFLSVRVLYYLATPSYLMFFFFRHSCSCIIRIRYYSIIDSIITFCFTRKYSSFHCFQSLRFLRSFS